MMHRIIFFLLALLILACNKNTIIKDDQPLDENNDYIPPKNIILLIGDGMGISQITAGMIANNNKTALEKFPVTGLHKNTAYDNLITDSAAGATAFACGVKTYNGAVGVGPDTMPVMSILEEAENKNMLTGLISTSTIVHATPASFIAHNRQRRNYEEIATDFLKTDIDFFIGGGKKYFDRRSDDRDLIEELIGKGYQISDYFKEDLDKVKISKNMYGYLTSDEDPLPYSGGRDYLLLATQMGLSHLSKAEEGFFLMIEGSQIDWGGHSNLSDYIIAEFLDFDRTIEEVITWAEKDGQTLVIVTADHETGGYSINPGSTKDSLVTAFTSDYHTGTLIPVFAYGPGAELFGGIYDNTAIYHKMREAKKWK